MIMRFPILIWLFLCVTGAANNTVTIKPKTVGDIRVGMSFYEIVNKYPKKHFSIDTRETMGYETKLLKIFMNNTDAPSLEIELNDIQNPIAKRILVYDGKYKTVDGIGVGATLRDIQRIYRNKYEIKNDEGTFYAVIKTTGIAFKLDLKISIKHKWYSTKDASTLPQDARITSISVY